jgi:group I intron endonuclease
LKIKNEEKYDKRKDPKRKQEIKMENHELKLLGDNLPVQNNQRINIFGNIRTYPNNNSTKLIYMIRNTETGKIYIGQTEDVDKRKSKHSSDLNQTKHENSDMQLEYILYGSDKFIFEIIEFLNKDDNLLDREKYWIKYFNTEWPNGYNSPYIYNKEYVNRSSKKIIENILKIKNKNIAINLGKIKNYKLFIDIINKYKKEFGDERNFMIWKNR